MVNSYLVGCIGNCMVNSHGSVTQSTKKRGKRGLNTAEIGKSGKSVGKSVGKGTRLKYGVK